MTDFFGGGIASLSNTLSQPLSNQSVSLPAFRQSFRRSFRRSFSGRWFLGQALSRACPKCRVAESLSESFVGHFVELAHFQRNFDKVFRQRLTTKFGNESFGTSSSWSRRPSLHPAR